MAMFEVEVTFMVTYTDHTKTETLKTSVDQQTHALATGSSSREKLDGWAKNYFPAAKSARVVSMRKVQ